MFVFHHGGKPTMSTTIEINHPEELESCELLWRWLLSKTRNASYFQSLDWLRAYVKFHADRVRLRVLIVEAGGETLGILPLVVEREDSRVGPIRVLTYPLGSWGTFFGPIGPNPTATLALGLAHIQRTRRDWDMIDLRWVDKGRTDHGRTPAAMRSNGLQALPESMEQVALVDTSGTWEDYWNSHNQHWRNNMRRCYSKLAEKGAIRYVRYRPRGAAHDDGDPRWDLYRACEMVAARSWQQEAPSGNTLSHPSVRPLLHEVHARAAKSGNLDVNLLYVADRPVAFAYNYHHDGSVFGLRTGYDSQLDFKGAGTLLMGSMIQDSFLRDDRLINLGAGYLEHKRRWLTSIAQSYRYTHFANTALRVQALRVKRLVRGLVKREPKAA